jgi:hypothetical protein
MTTKQQQAADNRANQLNPTHPAYHLSRGASPEEAPQLAAQEALPSSAAPEQGAATQQPGKPSPK